MADIEFTHAAVADLSEIDEYSLVQFGAEAGEAYMRGFNKALALLRDHPLAGAITPSYGKAYRCLVHQRHRIFYTITADKVLIVRVLHHARDAKGAMEGAE